MSTRPNRYAELIASQPTGSFWAARGRVQPYIDGTYDIEVDTGIANSLWAVYDNEAPAVPALIQTDATGKATLQIHLDLGDHIVELRLVEATVPTTFRAYITIRSSATVLAAFAEMLEVVDDNVLAVRRAPRAAEADGSFLELLHGRQLHQPNDLGTFLTESYRRLLQELRQGYRLWGQAQAGLDSAVGAFTHSSPWIVPRKWRPRWVLGDHLGGGLWTFSRDTASVLSSINAKSFGYVHAGLAANNPSNDFPGPFTALPTPQPVRVTFGPGWDGGDVIVTGLDVGGSARTEVFLGGTGITVEGSQVFASVTAAQKTVVGASTALARIGTTSTKFVTVDVLETPRATLSSATLTYTFAGSTLSWRSGEAIDVSAGGRFVLRELPIEAMLFGAAEGVPPGGLGSSTIDLSGLPALDDEGDYTRLYLSYDNRGVVAVDLMDGGTSPVTARTRADIVSAINNAVSSDTRYGAAYSNVAQVAANISGGYNAETIKLWVQNVQPASTKDTRIEVHLGGHDASQLVLGLPRIATTLNTARNQGETTLTVADASRFPSAVKTSNPLASFDIRVGRGINRYGTNATVSNVSGSFCDLTESGVLGPDLAGDVAGWVRVYDAVNSNNDGVHAIVSISSDPVNPIFRLRHETGGTFTSVSGNVKWALYQRGTIYTVVSNDQAAPGTWELETGLKQAYPSGTQVELATAYPVVVNGRDGPGTLDVTIDPAEEPGADASDSLSVEGATAPDGWLLENTNSASILESGRGHLPILLATGDGVGSLRLSRQVPRVLEFRGLDIAIGFWVQQHFDQAGTSFEVSVSWDGATFTALSPQVLVPGTVIANVTDPWQTIDPAPVRVQTKVPFDATSCVVRLEHAGVTPLDGPVTIHRATVRAAMSQGLHTGSHTVPRSAVRAEFGELIYIWNPEVTFSSAERAAIGIPTTQPNLPDGAGHIDEVLPVHSYIERFDVTEDTGTTGVPDNLVGVYDAVQWHAATLTNMESYPSTPPRTSYVAPVRKSSVSGYVVLDAAGAVLAGPYTDQARAEQEAGTLSVPTTVSYRRGETITVAGVAPHTTSLVEVSSHGGTFPQAPSTAGSDRLYENGLPLPATGSPLPWRFNSATEVEVDVGVFNGTAVYEVDYDVLIRAECPVLDLGASYADYLWLVDVHAYLRADATLVEEPGYEAMLDFGDSRQALLPERANLDKSAALLYVDDGIARQAVAASSWSFVDPRTVQIDPAAYTPGSVYTLVYTARFASRRPNPSMVIEARSSGTSEADVAQQPWHVVEAGDVVDSTHRYHQLRVSFADVIDERDVRLGGVGLRGVHLFGASPSAPGII